MATAPISIPDLPGLLLRLGGQIPLLDAQRAGAGLYDVPRLSVLKLLKPNENALSRVVSDFFDPHGIHGQEPLFMNDLLSAIGMPRVGVRDVVRVK